MAMNIPVYLSERLNTQHLSLPSLITGLSDEQLTRNPSPGKWSIRDNIAHLARYQRVFIERVNTILSVNEPVFEAYRAETDPEFVSWQNKGKDELIRELEIDRRTMNSLLHGLTEKELERRGRHLKFGNMTIMEWTEFFLLHEAHHLFTIFRLAHDM
jgi:uncharacterized damage-inducible protein DinB